MKLFQQLLLMGILVLPLMAIGCSGGPDSPSFGEHIDDSVITSKVKTKLLRDPQVSGLDISVDTFKGRVALNGFVDNQSQIEQAVRLAREVQGVRTVENNLTVK
jgi:hyperosmotically inducible protein